MKAASTAVLMGALATAVLGGATRADGNGEAAMASARPDEAARTLDTHHLFTPPATRQAWEARRKQLRTQVLFSAGLWPMPDKTPLHPLVTGRVEGPDYTIQNVAIETMPGFYLCGNLYEPKGKKGPFPGIVNPHGHWNNGRLEIEPDVPKAAPPPAKPAPGRANLVAIGVNLARQGFVVFAYDMVGYNDTNQIPNHRTFGNNPRAWLWNASLLGLQTWNSIRVVDYLCSLPEVDKARIGVTGASGGGTQTFLLTAVDDRVQCSVPVNMVCAYMQGGCLCENGPGLRVGTDNPEIAALFAPKPMLLVAATGDWTSHVPTEEWPTIKRVYDLYGAGDRTACVQFNYEHNYNVESREAMYAWFGRWLLHDPNPEHFRERPYTAATKAMRVWTDAHPMPADALKEPALEQAMVDRSEKQLAALWPRDVAGLKPFQEVYRPGLEASLAVQDRPAPSGRAATARGAQDAPGQAIIVVERGQEGLAGRMAQSIAGQNYAVRIVEVGGQAADIKLKPTDGFYACYNQMPVGAEVQTILAALNDYGRGRRVDIVGVGKAGAPALLARALAPMPGRVVIDAAGFDTGSDDAYLAGLYAPGLQRAGGLPAAAMLAAPSPLCLFNTAGRFQTDALAAGYRALHAPLKVETGPMSAEQIVAWLSAKQD